MFENYISFLFSFQQKENNEIKSVYLGVVLDKTNEKISHFTYCAQNWHTTGTSISYVKFSKIIVLETITYVNKKSFSKTKYVKSKYRTDIID